MIDLKLLLPLIDLSKDISLNVLSKTFINNIEDNSFDKFLSASLISSLSKYLEIPLEKNLDKPFVNDFDKLLYKRSFINTFSNKAYLLNKSFEKFFIKKDSQIVFFYSILNHGDMFRIFLSNDLSNLSRINLQNIKSRKI